MGKHKGEIELESFTGGVANSVPALDDLVGPADAEGHIKKATLHVHKQGTEQSDGEPADGPAAGLRAAPGDGPDAASEGKVSLPDFHFTQKTWKEGEGPIDGPSSPDGLASPSPPPQEAGVDYLLEIEGIKGEAIEHTGGVSPAVGDVTGDSSMDAAQGHKDWINIESVSQNIHKPGGGASSAMGDGSVRGMADALQPPPDPQEMGSHAAGGGGGAGKVQMRDFLLAEEDGPSSLASLEPQQQADSDYLTFKLEDTLISHVSPSVGDADREFPKIKWTTEIGGVESEDTWQVPD